MRSNHLAAVLPSLDLVRGLSQASTPFLQGLSKQGVDGRDNPAMTPEHRRTR